MMFKGTVGTMVASQSLASFNADSPGLAVTAGAALTGTAPSPSGALSGTVPQLYGFIS
jgi:hypothetical protein